MWSLWLLVEQRLCAKASDLFLGGRRKGRLDWSKYEQEGIKRGRLVRLAVVVQHGVGCQR